MTRTASIPRIFASIVAGGSLLAGVSASADDAPQTDANAASVDGTGPAVLTIAPLRVELEGEATGATVRLTNSSDHALPVQTRLFSWRQEKGDDVYAPSTELTVSPSITSIPAGETQVVRILRKGAASPGEKRFRLVVDQLPDPTKLRPGQAQTRIRFTVPVFLDRDKAEAPQFAWRVTRDGLELANTGGLTARILELKASGPDGRALEVQRNTLRYVLGKSTISWPLGNGCPRDPVRVTAQIDGQTVDGVASPACG